LYAHGTRRHKFGSLRYNMEGYVFGDRVSIKCKGTLTDRTAPIIGMWVIIRICCKIPYNKVFTPIAHGSYHQTFYFIGNIHARYITVLNDHLLCKINILIRSCLMNKGHGTYIATVMMKP